MFWNCKYLEFDFIYANEFDRVIYYVELLCEVFE